MSLLLEFIAVVSAYMFFITLALKLSGGAELRHLEREIKKELERARRGDEEAFKRLNRLNMKRFKLMMRPQLYIIPVALLFFYFIKQRYVSLSVSFLGIRLGWLGLFFIVGIAVSMLSEKIISRLLG